MSVHAWHGDLSWVVVVANGLAGLWALGAHWSPPLRHPALWWFTIAAQVTIFVQAIFGVVLVAAQGYEVDHFHMFYGFVSLVVVGLIYSYRQQLDPWRYVLYGFGGLFLMGMAIRAMTLGV
ncbi:MAG: hypothetical protein ACXIVQ_15150 [Acidimicrobiales bacterium]